MRASPSVRGRDQAPSVKVACSSQDMGPAVPDARSQPDVPPSATSMTRPFHETTERLEDVYIVRGSLMVASEDICRPHSDTSARMHRRTSLFSVKSIAGFVYAGSMSVWISGPLDRAAGRRRFLCRGVYQSEEADGPVFDLQRVGAV